MTTEEALGLEPEVITLESGEAWSLGMLTLGDLCTLETDFGLTLEGIQAGALKFTQMAGLLWLAARKAQPTLKLETVHEKVTLADVNTALPVLTRFFARSGGGNPAPSPSSSSETESPPSG